jgi:cytochrome b pre-mRNA-processing protein 3
MALARFFRPKPHKEAARRLYEAVVRRAREQVFYTQLGVADTLEGRFDMVALHAFLILHRLKSDHGSTNQLAQAFFDLMFADMDQNLRELGVGDMSIGRRIRKMAERFYGRVAAYESGLQTSDNTALQDALDRNLYREVTTNGRELAVMASYIREQVRALDSRSTDDLLSGEVSFGPLPTSATTEESP